MKTVKRMVKKAAPCAVILCAVTAMAGGRYPSPVSTSTAVITGTNGIAVLSNVASIDGYATGTAYTSRYLGTDTGGSWGLNSFPVGKSVYQHSAVNFTSASNGHPTLVFPAGYSIYTVHGTFTPVDSDWGYIAPPDNDADGIPVPNGTLFVANVRVVANGFPLSTLIFRTTSGSDPAKIYNRNGAVDRYYQVVLEKTGAQTWVSSGRTTSVAAIQTFVDYSAASFCPNPAQFSTVSGTLSIDPAATLTLGGVTTTGQIAFSTGTGSGLLTVGAVTTTGQIAFGTGTGSGLLTASSFATPTGGVAGANFWVTPEGGYAIKMTATSTLVAGEVVCPSDIKDGAVEKAPAQEDDPIGVVYANTTSGNACWVVTGGIGYVIPLATATATRGMILTVATGTAGRVDMNATVPQATEHNREVGHYIETATAAGVAARAVIHFN